MLHIVFLHLMRRSDSNRSTYYITALSKLCVNCAKSHKINVDGLGAQVLWLAIARTKTPLFVLIQWQKNTSNSNSKMGYLKLLNGQK